MSAIEHVPNTPDDFFAEITTLMAEGRSGEAYEYKTQWYGHLMAQMSQEDLDRLENIDAELFLAGHVPSTREKSKLPTLPLDPRLSNGSDGNGRRAGDQAL